MAGVAGASPRNINQEISRDIVPKVTLEPMTAMPQAMPDDSDPLAALASQYEEPGTIPAVDDDPLAALAAEYSAPGDSADPVLAYGGAVAQGTTLGYMPQIAGAAQALQNFTTGPNAGLPAGITGVQPKGYTQARDEMSAELKRLETENPIASKIGTGASIVTGLATLPAVGAVSGPINLVNSIKQGMKVGAIFGMASNPGDDPDAINPVQLKQRLIHGGVGLGLGGFLGAAGYGAVEHAIPYLAPKLKTGFEKAMSVFPRKAPQGDKTFRKVEATVVGNEPRLGPARQEMGVKQVIDDAEEAMQAAEAAGTQLRSNEVFPNDPVLRAAHEQARSSPAFQKAQLARAAKDREVVMGLRTAFQPKGITPEQAIQKVALLDRFHGEEIGGFREEVIANSEKPLRELTEEPVRHQQQMFLPDLPTGEEAAARLYDRPGEAQWDTVKRVGSNVVDALRQSEQQGFLQAHSADMQNLFARQGKWVPGKVKRMSMTQLQQTLDELRGQHGYTKDGPPPASIAKELPIELKASPAELKFIFSQLNKFTGEMVKNEGKMSPRQADYFYTRLTKMANRYAPEKGEPASHLFMTVVKLKDAFRDDFANGGKQFVDPSRHAAYDFHMERYSVLKQLPERTKRLLRVGSAGNDDIIAWMDQGGLSNKKDVEAFMNAANLEVPEAAEAIRQGYTNRLLEKFRRTGPQALEEEQRISPLRWDDLYDHLTTEKGYDRLAAVTGEKFADTLLMHAKARRLYDKKPFGDTTSKFQVLKAMFNLVKLNPEEAYRVFHIDNAAKEILADDAVQKAIKRMAPLPRRRFEDLYNRLLKEE